MKLSISLPSEDVAVLDEFSRSTGLASRSAAVHHAVQLLRHPDLERDYEHAWTEWVESGEQDAWDGTAGDGLAGAPR